MTFDLAREAPFCAAYWLAYQWWFQLVILKAVAMLLSWSTAPAEKRGQGAALD